MVTVKIGSPLTVWCMALAGSVALVIALWLCFNSWHLGHRGVRTTGVVVEMSKPTYQRDVAERSSAPTFRFRDAAGMEHTIQSHLWQSPPAHRVGDVVPVVYPPSAPGNARIYKFNYFWLA